ncbi:MAG TPA: quinolinate synthase NadA [Myxococcota bacterium]|nr:quinolinate synthase NadA [Myxococcota bacterium]
MSNPRGIELLPDIPICQTDLPLDWYQPEFKPYAEEYLALPDRLPQTVLPWMDRYIEPARAELGPSLVLLAHYYMGGEIVKLVERYGGLIADSYQLAREAVLHPEKRVFVESAVHFMAEAIALLAAPEQQVWITNPKSGCTMEMMAKEFMIAPAFAKLEQRYGESLMVIAYMNTSGRVKALAGRTGGAVCTSSNAGAIMRWAIAQNKKIFFVPDQHLGRNVADEIGLPQEKTLLVPAGHEGADLSEAEVQKLDAADLLLWGSFCGVHTIFKPSHVAWWRGRGYQIAVHPESPREVVSIADFHGSTSQLWKHVLDAPSGSRFAVATEGHFVNNLREQARLRGILVVHLADVPGDASAGCGCATMSRNDPPHLVALLDLLRKGKAPDLNRVLPGDVVDEVTGARERLDVPGQRRVAADARRALERMIEITEAARAR